MKCTTRKINIQERGLQNFFGPLMRAALPSMKSLLTPLANIFLLPLGVTAAASATNAVI